MISSDAIRGYVDLIVLSLVRTGPSYAYGIARQVWVMTATEYALKQTTLYSALKRLEASGLVTSFPGTSESGKPRTYYQITTPGLAHLERKIDEWRDTKTLVDRFVEGTS